ncbi:hypothetical protein [Enterobacter sp. ENT03]|uniref:hypothetical protein n=1 Tax=Enterobacter sp. ENT03 TaxID=2854780 RepID=UPI001C46614D|nr:hypothetical protein [Enterobacter sp. ENT03]MBV7405272.1 hypothetical protein [Enterobacter sp. ENT03]
MDAWRLWFTLPLITFIFSTPLISFLAAHYHEKNSSGENKAVLVVRHAYTLIIFSIIFFVLSCILNIPHETLVAVKAQRQNHCISTAVHRVLCRGVCEPERYQPY